MKVEMTIQNLEERARIVDAAMKLVWLPPFAAAAYGGFKLTKMWELISSRAIPSANNGGITVVKREAVDKYWLDRMRSPEVEQIKQRVVSGLQKRNVDVSDDCHKVA